MSLLKAPVLGASHRFRSLAPSKQVAASNLNIELYRKIYLIRRAEAAICEHYAENEMKTPMHMSAGSEAISAGVCQALCLDDQVVGTYRSHALYLAKTMETRAFFAEMYGKSTGYARGKAGSMHLASPSHGMMGSSAIVAAHIPVAVGLAFANKYQKNGKMVAAFFGDGAVDEGVFWESMNGACLFELPILFVCEDNGLAVHTKADSRHGYDAINDVVREFHCNPFEEDTTDPERIYRITREAIRLYGKNRRPAFLHFHYYRYLEHVGINDDFDAGYRSSKEFAEWKMRDPLALQRSKLEMMGVDMASIQRLERDVDAMVSSSVQLAQQAPFSQVDETYDGVFACDR